MNIQTLINKRLPITHQQEEMLIGILSNGCREQAKRRIKSIVKYSFYSAFDGKWFSTRFDITDNGIVYTPGQDMKSEISTIRKELLK